MARRKTYGFSFSWKRAIGLSAARGKIARATGIPTTRSGMERKIGRAATGGCSIYLCALVMLVTMAAVLIGCRQAPQTAPSAPVVTGSPPMAHPVESPADSAPLPATVQPAPSSEPAVSTTVYVTDTGERYHQGSCSSLRRSKHSISLEDAEARGYTPCQHCAPPE